MPAIKINDTHNHANYGIGSAINFTLFSAPRHGRNQIRSFAACRDYINDCVIAYVNRSEPKPPIGLRHWQDDRNSVVDMQFLRLLIAKNPERPGDEVQTERRIFDAKRIINMYEGLTNWKRKSVISRVNHSSGLLPHCWALTGPGQWMRASQLISMVTLIFRVVEANGGFHDVENLDDVEARFAELHKLAKKATGSERYKKWRSDVVDILNPSWPKFRMLMEMNDFIFGQKDKQFWYPKANVTNWHGQGGIRSLCTFNLPKHQAAKMKEAVELYSKKNE